MLSNMDLFLCFTCKFYCMFHIVTYLLCFYLYVIFLLFLNTLQIIHHLTYISCFYLYVIFYYFLRHYKSYTIWPIYHVLPVHYLLKSFTDTLQIVHHLTYLSCFYLYVIIINYFLPHYKLLTVWPIYYVFTCTLLFIISCHITNRTPFGLLRPRSFRSVVNL